MQLFQLARRLPPAPHRQGTTRRRRAAARLTTVAAAVASIWLLACVLNWCLTAIPARSGTHWTAILISVVLIGYALMLAVPFVPGAEIGLGLIAVAGTQAAPLVYGATVLGLSLAFFAGRCLPEDRIGPVLRRIGARRLADRIETLARSAPADRLDALQDRLPRALARLPLGARYAVLAGLINLPGSTAIGGGGGICLAAGASRLFHPAVTLATLALAVLPVPLALWLWGAAVPTF